METIEERAEAIYKGNTIEEEAYKRGATEQKTIDIDYACEWLKVYMLLGASLRNISLTHLLEDFRKAMEED